MKRLSKQDAAQFYGVTVSTIDRRIHKGDLHTETEPHGKSHRIFVLVEEGVPPAGSTDVQLAVAQEAIRRLEELVEAKDEALVRERETTQELIDTKDQALAREREAAVEKEMSMQVILKRLEEAQHHVSSLTAMLPPAAYDDPSSPPDEAESGIPPVVQIPRIAWWRILFGKTG